MPIEVELKIRISDPEFFLARLGECAEKIGHTMKEDHYFVPAALADADVDFLQTPFVRIRRDGQAFFVNAKVRELRGGVEVNDEIEFPLDHRDVETFRRFLAYLGYRHYLAKSKSTHLFTIGHIHVEVNEVLGLGHFLEIEQMISDPDLVTRARSDLLSLAEDLGADLGRLETRPYLHLLKEKRDTNRRCQPPPAAEAEPPPHAEE